MMIPRTTRTTQWTRPRERTNERTNVERAFVDHDQKPKKVTSSSILPNIHSLLVIFNPILLTPTWYPKVKSALKERVAKDDNFILEKAAEKCGPWPDEMVVPNFERWELAAPDHILL